MTIFESDSESITTTDGRRVLKDTKALWDEFRIVVDDDIRNEISGKLAPGGRNWNQRWLASIENLRKDNRENYQRYIDYIIDERRRQGLPELHGL